MTFRIVFCSFSQKTDFVQILYCLFKSYLNIIKLPFLLMFQNHSDKKRHHIYLTKLGHFETNTCWSTGTSVTIANQISYFQY